MPKINKRGNGEGTIYQRPDGRWMAQGTIGRDYETGKPKRVTFYGKTRKEVQEKLANALHSQQKGTYVPPSKITFADWLDTWLKEYAKSNIRPTTYGSYEYLISVC